MPKEGNSAPPGEVTVLLRAIRGGNREAEQALVSLIHDELHRAARRLMRGERRDHTLQPTALVNEAYLRLIRGAAQDWNDRTHFFIVATQVMRRILVDHARARSSKKRGAAMKRVVVGDGPAALEENWDEIIAVDEALGRLGGWDEQQGRIVELRFFGGFSEEETAEILSISSRTVRRDWKTAKAWLRGELETRRVFGAPRAD
jgi:RNA polymerase sigma factor (TIGR02999 family)